MAETEIALLKTQIERLHDRNFDLDAWKNHTIIFLERIFGKESTKLKMIKDLDYNYSSWNLRDTAAVGKTNEKDPVVLQAEEILNASIAELIALGLPKEKKEKEKLRELLNDELTGKQIRELNALFQSEDAEKSEKVTNILEAIDKERLAAIILKLLTE